MSQGQCEATVIIPTHDHGATIRYPIEALQRQTVTGFEAFIVGDGVPEPLKPPLRALIAGDARFRFVDRPKHSRRGEPYRHEVLLEARGRIVCYLCDRDIWLPDHLAAMGQLLVDADFAHSLPVHVLPGGGLRAFPVDLGYAGYRHMMLSAPDNRIPFSCFGHTLAAYRRLPEGWATTPDGAWTDLHMFRKFFASPLRGVSGLSPTAVTFPSPARRGWGPAERVAELGEWAARLATHDGRLGFERDILRETVAAQRAEAARLGQLAADLQRRLAPREGQLWRKLV